MPKGEATVKSETWPMCDATSAVVALDNRESYGVSTIPTKTAVAGRIAGGTPCITTS